MECPCGLHDPSVAPIRARCGSNLRRAAVLIGALGVGLAVCLPTASVASWAQSGLKCIHHVAPSTSRGSPAQRGHTPAASRSGVLPAESTPHPAPKAAGPAAVPHGPWAFGLSVASAAALALTFLRLRRTDRTQGNAFVVDPDHEDGLFTAPALSRRQAGRMLLPVALWTSCTWDVMAAALDRTAAAEDGRWAFAYPDGWEVARKPLKTHFQELEVVSKTIKKCSVGLAVDPIRLSRLEDFGDPNFVGGRVVGVERSRDGVSEATLLAADGGAVDGLTYYTVEYAARSSRGDYHYLARIAVSSGYLFVMTAKVPQDAWPAAEPTVRDILSSLRVTAA